MSFVTAVLGALVIVESLRALSEKALPRWVWFGAGGVAILVSVVIGGAAAVNRAGGGVDLPSEFASASPTPAPFVIAFLAILILLLAGVELLRESQEARKHLNGAIGQIRGSFGKRGSSAS